MVFGAGEVLRHFRTNKERPMAISPKQSGRDCRPPHPAASLPSTAGLDGGSGLAPHSLLSPAVLTGSPRSPEALRGRRLINQGGNGPGGSSPAVPALCVSPCSCGAPTGLRLILALRRKVTTLSRRGLALFLG